LAAVIELSSQPRWQGKRCVVMLPDAGERYVSTALFRGLSE
jgi:cysteine synthase A